MRTPLAPLALLTLLGAGTGAGSRADEPKREEPSTLRLFPVAALVQGRSDHLPERLGIVGSNEVSDQARPLFGAEGEEPVLPVGNVDELAELVRYHVEPGSWDSLAGALIQPLGWRQVLVRQRPEALAGVGATLKRLEDRWLKPIVVEVLVVRLPPDLPAVPSPEALAALAAAADAGPGLTLAALPGQRVTGFTGRQASYLQEYDVEVATKSAISDPIVGVLSTGLSVACRATPAEDGSRVRLDLDAQAVLLRSLEPVPAGEGRKVESPLLDTVSGHMSVELPVSVWTLLDGAGARSGSRAMAFLARARLGERATGPAATGTSLPVLESAGMGRLEDRAFSVALLTQPVGGRLARTMDLLPSNFTPPEPPELREPEPAIQPDTLIELLRQAIAPEAWGSRGGSVEARFQTLHVRAPEAALAAAARLLATLESTLVQSIEVEAEVIEAPATAELTTGTLLTDKQSEALAAALAAGTAQRLDRVRVSSLNGARNNVHVGDQRTILSDYEVEIAEATAIGNPVVTSLVTGVTLDVEPALSSTGDSAVIVARFTRSELVGLRSVATTVGEMQCPEVRMTKLRNDLEVPFGRTGVLGATVEGGKRVLVLLTPRRLGRR